MFNKLIIAVLTLGLLLTFCSAAISSDVPKVGVNRVETSNPNAPKLNLATPIERPVSGNQKRRIFSPQAEDKLNESQFPWIWQGFPR